MITYINSANAKQYTKLFSEAEDALIRSEQLKNPEKSREEIVTEIFGGVDEDGAYVNGINSLNSYFSRIKDLLGIDKMPVFEEDGSIKTDTKGEIVTQDFPGLKFAMLPVDEDVFEIDANTRKITVPTAFTQNGLSVQSDEISEVVYFKINRFYDATDLMAPSIHPMIEWIAPSGKKGYSMPTAVFLDETTNFIIFGWALSSVITEQAGNVTFAVRFYNYDNDSAEIKYSLSTLTAQAPIKPNIGLDIFSLLKNGAAATGEEYVILGENVKSLMRERAENSNIGAGGDSAEEPIFLEFVKSEVLKNNVVTILNDGTATVIGSGYTPDAGTISYFWKHHDYDTNERQANPDFTENYTDIKAVDAELIFKNKDMNVIFYRLADTSVGEKRVYTPISDWEAEITNAVPPVETVYRKDSKVSIVTPGIYTMVIKNRVGRASKEFECDPLVAYPAMVPVIDDIDKAVFLNDENEAKRVINITAKTPELDNTSRLPKFKDSTEFLADKNYKFDPSTEKLSYNWTMVKLGETEEVKLDTHEATLTPQFEGEYKCVVVGSLNNDTAESEVSDICRVTYNPAKVAFAIEGIDEQNGSKRAKINNFDFEKPVSGVTKDTFNAARIVVGGYGENAPLNLYYTEADMKGEADHQLTDNIHLQWYCYSLPDKDKDPDFNDVVDAMMGNYKPQEKDTISWMKDDAEGDGVDINVNNLTAGENGRILINSFVPDKDGYYFCMITNTYNGKSVTVSTPMANYNSPND